MALLSYLPTFQLRALVSAAVDFAKFLFVLRLLLTWLMLKVQQRPPSPLPLGFAS